jgi:hypothetical protein
LLYSGITRNKQSLIFGIIALCLEFFASINPVIEYLQVETAVIQLAAPIEPVKPERKTSNFWHADREYNAIYQTELTEYNKKMAIYNQNLLEVNQFNAAKNRKKPDFWQLLKLVIDAIFSAVFLPAAVWLFSNPVKTYLDDLQTLTSTLQTLTDLDKSHKQLDKPIDIDCQKVLSLYESGITVIELSERLNCSRQTIYNYIKKAKKTNLKPISLVVDNSQKNKIREVK